MADDITPLAHSLERFFQNLGAPPISVITRLSDEWSSIVGPALGGVTSPVSVIDAELTVVCSEPAWSSQISWMETQICEEFGKRFAPEEITSVRAILH